MYATRTNTDGTHEHAREQKHTHTHNRHTQRQQTSAKRPTCYGSRLRPELVLLDGLGLVVRHSGDFFPPLHIGQSLLITVVGVAPGGVVDFGGEGGGGREGGRGRVKKKQEQQQQNTYQIPGRKYCCSSSGNRIRSFLPRFFRYSPIRVITPHTCTLLE